jgi:serine/threonine-protein kinase
MTSPAHPDDPQILGARTRLGMILQEKWRLEAVLGVGGMAAVYAATHRNGKRVAVKMLHADLAHDEELKKRFLQEGYAANTIQHDGAVSVLDDDVAPDGSAFIVMELLEGETIEQRSERSGGVLPVHEVLSIADQLLDVLSAAHAKNVVHRDIKPENLFLTKAGALKVLDFGIARVHEAQQARAALSATSTRAGTVMGTPAFMAPEQARGRWDEVDGRTDLWAVGATMFTLLTGRFVHEGSGGNEQLIMSATTRAPPLANVAATAPGAVCAIVDRALAFEKDRRWPDADTMQQAVRLALDALGDPGSLAAASGARPIGARTATAGALPVGTRTGVESARTASGGAGGTPSRLLAPAQPVAATVIDATGRASAVSAWTRERELRTTEAAKQRGGISELQQRYAAARKRTTDAQSHLEAGRAERVEMEQWFKRQVGTRTAAVEEARKSMRAQLVAIARRAVADHTLFGAEFDGAREQVAKLQRAAESAARDVTVHEASLVAFDAGAMRRGRRLLALAAALLLALVVGPVVWRATRVVEAPPLHGAATGAAPKPEHPSAKP